MTARFDMAPSHNTTSDHGRRLGSSSAQKAGVTRMALMTKEQRIEFGKRAANIRWSKIKGNNKYEKPRRTNG